MLAAMTHPSRVLNLDMKAKLCMPKSYILSYINIYIYIYIYIYIIIYILVCNQLIPWKSFNPDPGG